MREIKFRGWDKANSKMIPWEDFKNTPYIRGNFLGEFNSDDSQIFMQFTGLKDKNGKEIYEGDVVRVDGLNVKVDWYVGAWTVEYFTTPKRSYLSNFDETDIEIIGNIYENPELAPK